MNKQGLNSEGTNESGSIYTGETEQSKLDLKTTPLQTWHSSSGKVKLSEYNQENGVELREYHFGAEILSSQGGKKMFSGHWWCIGTTQLCQEHLRFKVQHKCQIA